MNARTAIALCLLLPWVALGCLESNPQPSPGTGALQEVMEEDTGTIVDRTDTTGVSDHSAPWLDVDLGGEVAVEDAFCGGCMEGGDCLCGEVQCSDVVVEDVPSDAPVSDCFDGGMCEDALSDVLDADWTDGGGDVFLPPECQYCQLPYPACVEIEGIWSCVQCLQDSDCGAAPCFCDVEHYSCGGCPDYQPWDCTEDLDCYGSMICDESTEICYDPEGWCDDVTSFCNTEQGSTCEDPLTILFPGGPPSGSIPGMPVNKSVCTCTEPLEIGAAMACLEDPLCSTGGCHPGMVCIQLQILCLMMFDDCPQPNPDTGICVSPSMFDLVGM